MAGEGPEVLDALAAHEADGAPRVGICAATAVACLDVLHELRGVLQLGRRFVEAGQGLRSRSNKATSSSWTSANLQACHKDVHEMKPHAKV